MQVRTNQFKNNFHSGLLSLSVSQLAKSPCLTLKTNTTNDLEVGRHENPSRPPARVRTCVRKKQYEKECELRIDELKNFIDVMAFMNPQISTDCGFERFKESIFESVTSEYRILLYDLVGAFTLQNKKYRVCKKQKYVSEYDDYMDAINLIRWALQPLEKMYSKTYKRILALIENEFINKKFRVEQIVQKTNLCKNTIVKILQELQRNKKLERIKSQVWEGRAIKPCIFFKYK